MDAIYELNLHRLFDLLASEHFQKLFIHQESSCDGKIILKLKLSDNKEYTFTALANGNWLCNGSEISYKSLLSLAKLDSHTKRYEIKIIKNKFKNYCAKQRALQKQCYFNFVGGPTFATFILTEEIDGIKKDLRFICTIDTVNLQNTKIISTVQLLTLLDQSPDDLLQAINDMPLLKTVSIKDILTK